MMRASRKLKKSAAPEVRSDTPAGAFTGCLTSAAGALTVLQVRDIVEEAFVDAWRSRHRPP